MPKKINLNFKKSFKNLVFQQKYQSLHKNYRGLLLNFLKLLGSKLKPPIIHQKAQKKGKGAGEGGVKNTSRKKNVCRVLCRYPIICNMQP